MNHTPNMPLNKLQSQPLSEQDAKLFARAELGSLSAAARASVVNRTHRVVRERAQTMAARRNRVRSLWIPVAVCSALLAIFSSSIWSLLGQYSDVVADEIGTATAGIPDSSNQFLVLLLWFLPVSLTMLALVMFRRVRKHV